MKKYEQNAEQNIKVLLDVFIALKCIFTNKISVSICMWHFFHMKINFQLQKFTFLILSIVRPWLLWHFNFYCFCVFTYIYIYIAFQYYWIRMGNIKSKFCYCEKSKLKLNKSEKQINECHEEQIKNARLLIMK